MPSIKEFIEAMSASWPVALAIMVGSCAVLAGDYYDLPQLAGVPDWLVGAAYIVAAFSGATLAVGLLRWMIALATLPFRRMSAEKWRNEHVQGLSDLPPDEVGILVWALANGRQVVVVEFFDDRIKALAAKGYLTMVPGNHRTNQVPYRIPEHVWRALKNEEIPHDVRQELLNHSPFGRW